MPRRCQEIQRKKPQGDFFFGDGLITEILVDQEDLILGAAGGAPEDGEGTADALGRSAIVADAVGHAGGLTAEAGGTLFY